MTTIELNGINLDQKIMELRDHVDYDLTLITDDRTPGHRVKSAYEHLQKTVNTIYKLADKMEINSFEDKGDQCAVISILDRLKSSGIKLDGREIVRPMGRPRKNPVLTDDQGQEYFEAVVTAQGTTGRLYPPRDWIGHRVRVTRID